MEKGVDLSKTKVLKLLYILDEASVKKSGIPFFNLTYKVWKFGPVAEDIFIDLSQEKPTFLAQYISIENGNKFNALTQFSDDEFSENDMDLLENVVAHFGNYSANELVKHTHRSNSLWAKTAKANNVLAALESEEINNTEYKINLAELVAHDEFKTSIYNNYLECN